MVTYSTTAVLNVEFDQFSNGTNFLNYVKDPTQIPLLGGSTNTGLGMNLLRENSLIPDAGFRDEAPITFVLTDGIANDGTLVSAESDSLLAMVGPNRCCEDLMAQS